MGALQRPYDLIVFDWDGTLYDSTGYSLQGLKQAVIDLKMPMFDEADYQALSGLVMSDIINALYADSSEENRELLKIRYRFYALLHQKDTVLYPEVREVLAILKSYEYLLAVATGKNASGLQRDLENAKLLHWFDITRTADKTASKPNPLMLEEIMQNLNVSPEKTLMVGDSILDIQMAVNAHVDSVGIHDDPVQREVLLEQGAKTTVSSLRELLSFLGTT